MCCTGVLCQERWHLDFLHSPQILENRLKVLKSSYMLREVEAANLPLWISKKNAIIFVGFKWPCLVLPQTYCASNNPCSLTEVSASVRKSWDRATSHSVPALTPPGPSLRGLLCTTAGPFLLLLDSRRTLVIHLSWGVHMKTF